jgi:hypothetical protein
VAKLLEILAQAIRPGLSAAEKAGLSQQQTDLGQQLKQVVASLIPKE